MKKIILADDQAIFRAGIEKVLATEGDIHIVARCQDCPRLYQAVATFRGSVIVLGSTLGIDIDRVVELAQANATRIILILENNESLSSSWVAVLHGVVYRNASSAALIDCVRRVLRGERVIPTIGEQREDYVGARVYKRLTPKEMKIVALIVQGYKNKEIGLRLSTTEQVIKNDLRNIYDKTGVCDRLELALFTIHHRTLPDAATSIGIQMGLSVANIPRPKAMACEYLRTSSLREPFTGRSNAGKCGKRSYEDPYVQL